LSTVKSAFGPRTTVSIRVLGDSLPNTRGLIVELASLQVKPKSYPSPHKGKRGARERERATLVKPRPGLKATSVSRYLSGLCRFLCRQAQLGLELQLQHPRLPRVRDKLAPEHLVSFVAQFEHVLAGAQVDVLVG
jgi:hypothetical protein